MNERIEFLINHWSDTSSKATVQDIRQMHLSKGWKDIGYHRVILHPESREFVNWVPDKWWQLVHLGRDLNDDLYIEQNEVGAHTLYHNRNSVGICTIGMPGLSLHPLQEQAIIMTNLALAQRFQLFDRLHDAVKGHRDFNATQCPGDEIYAILEHIRENY